MNKEILYTDDKLMENFQSIPNRSGSELLQRKTFRDTNDFRENFSRRCDICLEYEIYSDSKLLECINCRALCHLKCYNSNVKNIINNLPKNNFSLVPEFECQRCNFSKTNNLDQNLLRYL